MAEMNGGERRAVVAAMSRVNKRAAANPNPRRVTSRHPCSQNRDRVTGGDDL